MLRLCDAAVGGDAGGCRRRLALGDEGLPGVGEATAVVEDVAAHLGELLGPVGIERLARLVGAAGGPFALEQLPVIDPPRESHGLVQDGALELRRGAWAQVVGKPDPHGLGGTDWQAGAGQRRRLRRADAAWEHVGPVFRAE